MSRRRLFGSLCTMVFLVNLARVVFAPLIEPVAASFDVPAAELGVVATAAWVGSAVPRIPTGWLLTRVPRHRVVLGAGVVLTGASVFTAFAPSVPVLVGGAFLMGLASGAYFIAANPLVSELYPTAVGRALGVHGMASQIAAVAAPLLVGAVLAVGDWQSTFLLVAVAATLATVALVWSTRGADLPDAGASDQHLLRAARAQWPIVLVAVVVVGTMGFVWNGLFNFYVSYLKVAKGVPVATGRTLLTVVFAAGVPAFVVTGRLADRLPSVPLLFAVLGGFVASVFALTLASGFVAIVAASVVLGYVAHSLFPAVDTYLLATLPDEHRSSAYSVYSGTSMFVQAAGSWAVGSLVAAGLAYDSVFVGAAVGLGVVLLALLALYGAGRVPAGDAVSG